MFGKEENCCNGGADVAAGVFGGGVVAVVDGYTVAGRWGWYSCKDYVVEAWCSSAASEEMHCDQRPAACCRDVLMRVVGNLADSVVADTAEKSCAQVNGPVGESSDQRHFGSISGIAEVCYHGYHIESLPTAGISEFHVWDAVVSRLAVEVSGSFAVRYSVRNG